MDILLTVKEAVFGLFTQVNPSWVQIGVGYLVAHFIPVEAIVGIVVSAITKLPKPIAIPTLVIINKVSKAFDKKIPDDIKLILEGKLN